MTVHSWKGPGAAGISLLAGLRDVPWRVRRRALSIGRNAADQLPDPGPRWARRAAVLTGIVRPHPLPLVSIVVPIFRVQDFLAECLDSIVDQTHDNLQIVLVDDGSPDRSIDIMTAYARRDRRFEILRQRNAGLSAARNAGIREARGTYLMFVDSDDTLDPGAVASHVASLQRTGSDFSVAPYRRFNRAGRWAAAWWIREAHSVRRDRIKLRQLPAIQVNAVIWSKCFRRSFWTKHELVFPEGVLYEDQVVSSTAYALARRFDVLVKPEYNWRVREDQSSTTQQISSLEDLQARLTAAQSALDVLAAAGLTSSRDTRLIQFLRHDFQSSISAAQHSGDEYWDLLRQGLHRLTNGIPDNLWTQVSVQHRLAIHLVLEGLRAETTWFTGLGESDPKRSPANASNGSLYLDTPARHILGLPPTDPLLAFASHQLGLITSIRRLHWTDDGRLRITAWAYIDNVSLADAETPFDVRVWAETPGSGDGHRAVAVPLHVRSSPSPEVSAATKHRHADYERSVFVAELDPRTLIRSHQADKPVTWQLMVEVRAAGIRRRGPLREPFRAGSAGTPTARIVEEHEVSPRYGERNTLRLAVSPVRCRVEAAAVVDQQLFIEVQGLQGYAPGEIEISFPDGHGYIRQPLEQQSGDRARGQVLLPQTDPGQPHDEMSAGYVRQGQVRIISLDGTRSPAAILTSSTMTRQPFSLQYAGVTEFGNLCVMDEQRVVRVQSAEVTADHRLRLTGILAGLDAEEITLCLDVPKVRATGPARSTGPARFEGSIPLEYEAWQLGCVPLPTGRYRLTAQAKDRLGTTRTVPIRIQHSLLDQLPIQASTSLFLAQLRRGPASQLELDLMPPLTNAELGARPQEQLQRALRRRLSRPQREPRAVLFRSNYGEIAGCNMLAVHRELVRRNTGHTLYWAVKDYSVRVPHGGVPVLHDSAEWYRLLHEAEYYLDNMHQPIYHRKPAHQIQVQTFHGYPFKRMGLPNWRRRRVDVTQVQSYLERAADWDYFVSPATYASEPLRDAFGYPGDMLEIGYPRNDVLVQPDVDRRRAAVRERLGIRPDQTAILYAPTFRDDVANNDFTAAMVDFLDVHRLSVALGSSYVVLVRGHAFNARLTSRIGSSGHVLDVTDYPDVAELIQASDVAILDYSSIRFDYGLTGKPMIFLVPDLERYLNVSRGAIIPYQPTAPGPLLSNTDDVINAISNLADVERGWADARAQFRQQYLDLDDGHATKRLVDTVFVR